MPGNMPDAPSETMTGAERLARTIHAAGSTSGVALLHTGLLKAQHVLTIAHAARCQAP
jgi:hypothetical protein